MSFLSNLKDKFENVLTVDATPTTPRTPAEDDLLDLFDINGSPLSKISGSGSSVFTPTTEQSRQSACEFEATSDIKFPCGKSKYPEDDVNTDSGQERKNNGYKKKHKSRAKNQSGVNYNIINSSDVRICPKTSFICNINQHINATSSFSQKSKAIKPMPISIRDLSECQEEISQKDMLLIKEHLGSGWRDVAKKLNYSDGQLEQFQENFSSRGLDEIIYQFLLDWKRANSKDAKLGILVIAMWSSHQYECVKEIEKSRRKSSKVF